MVIYFFTFFFQPIWSLLKELMSFKFTSGFFFSFHKKVDIIWSLMRNSLWNRLGNLVNTVILICSIVELKWNVNIPSGCVMLYILSDLPLVWTWNGSEVPQVITTHSYLIISVFQLNQNESLITPQGSSLIVRILVFVYSYHSCQLPRRLTNKGNGILGCSRQAMKSCGKTPILFYIPSPSPQRVVYFIYLPESEVHTVVKDSFPVKRIVSTEFVRLALISVLALGLV